MAASMIDYVAQEHERGCGVAVLAMLTGRTWQETVDWIEWAEVPLKPWTMQLQLWRDGWYLRRANLPSDLGQKVWPPLPFAVAHYAMVTATKGGHWVVVDGAGRVFDPYDDTRSHLGWYSAVHEVVGLVR